MCTVPIRASGLRPAVAAAGGGALLSCRCTACAAAGAPIGMVTTAGAAAGVCAGHSRLLFAETVSLPGGAATATPFRSSAAGDARAGRAAAGFGDVRCSVAPGTPRPGGFADRAAAAAATRRARAARGAFGGLGAFGSLGARGA
jgi:hypothetical protein